MIESADCLYQKHFGKALIDKNVEILDPAAGTGTFIKSTCSSWRSVETTKIVVAMRAEKR